MGIGGRKLELGKGKRILNKVSVSTVESGVLEEEVRTPVAMGVGKEVAAAASVTPKAEEERVRIIEVEEVVPVPVEAPEGIEGGLTSPW